MYIKSTPGLPSLMGQKLLMLLLMSFVVTLCTTSKAQAQPFSGTKYNDLNNNGVRDPGEPGLAGWTIQAYYNGSTVTTTTDASGNYSFSSLPDGTWTLFEVQQLGWVQTGPHAMVYHVDVPGVAVSGLDFGNKEKCSNPSTVSLTVGENDDFNPDNGPEDTSPSPELQAAMNFSYPYASSTQLDNSGSDRVIGHTFTGFLPDGCYVTGARFIIHIKDLDATDAIVFLADGSGVWGATIPQILGSGWSSMIDATITFDLENLPAYPTTNILAALQDGDFDFFLQDDANIDYATLEVDYCCDSAPNMQGMGFRDINGSDAQWPIGAQITTGIGEHNNTGDAAVRALQARPNPFSDHTMLSYELRKAEPVSIDIFDALGNTVYTFDLGMQSAGLHEVRWNGVNAAGTRVATGIYGYSIKTPGGRSTGQIMLQK